jgi:origin recognition complex subunit 4
MPPKRSLDNTDASRKSKRRQSLQEYYDEVEPHHLHINSGSAKEFKESLDKEFPATHQPDVNLDEENNAVDAADGVIKKEVAMKKIHYDEENSIAILDEDITGGAKKAAFDSIKTQVLSKINGRQRTELVGLKEQYNEIYTLLEHTITEGEGNSCLLIGPRSCGKSVIMDTALDKLKATYKDQFITIRLSGFAQSDDKMALREICRQFDVELSKGFTPEEYEGLEKKSMSETLQSLIGLLDPPKHQFQDNNDEESVNVKTPVAVVILLDEFDRFTQVSRQTLLYNLFDMAQSSHTPLAVIGVTSRMNTREMFEKRVRSRFSQRVFAVNRPRSMDQFWGICKSVLTINLENITSDEGSNIFNTCAAEWNSRIESLYSHTDSMFYKLLERVFYTTKDVREVFDKLIYAIAKASPLLHDKEIFSYEKEQGVSTSQHFIEGLSELELALLICSARVEIKFESDTFNFNVVYDEYLDVANNLNKERMAAMSSADSGPGGGYRVWSRDVARSAWERLENLDLILHVETPGSNTQGAITATATGLVGDSKATGTVRDDLKMAKVDVNLLEIGDIIGRDHTLRKWTRL